MQGVRSLAIMLVAGCDIVGRQRPKDGSIINGAGTMSVDGTPVPCHLITIWVHEDNATKVDLSYVTLEDYQRNPEEPFCHTIKGYLVREQ